ncbi:MAG: AtpZ/AtpI family protein [Alphaproteobacteria bacterium]
MPTNSPKFRSKKKQLSDYARYSARGFPMAVVIVVCTLAGTKLDECLSLDTPIFTLILSLLSVVLVMYYFVKSFITNKK